MKVRVLDLDRSCLEGLPIPDPASVMPPGRTKTVVVEDEGRVVGTMSVMNVPYIEGTWVDQEHRTPGVLRALLRATWDLAREDGHTWAWSACADDAVATILSKLGGAVMPMSVYAVPLRRRF